MNSKTLCFLTFFAAALTAPLLRAQPPGAVCVASLRGSSATPTTAHGLYLRVTKPPAPAPKRGPQTLTRSGLATWYSRASCRREGTGGRDVRMANGRPLDDAAMTCAMWLTNSTGRPLRPDGRIVTISVANSTRSRCTTSATLWKTVTCAWTDNGPGRVPRSRGVIVDLSKAAMMALDPDGIRKGRVAVVVTFP
jgi:hypothetical protein